MYPEPSPEDLLQELSRLVGRPSAVVQDALSRALFCLEQSFGPELLAQLGAYPLTAWPALAGGLQSGRLWAALGSAGLTQEEGFTALAVIDDHVRRRYGNDAWLRLGDWASTLGGCTGAVMTHIDSGHVGLAAR